MQIRTGAVNEFMYFYKRDPGTVVTAGNLKEAIVIRRNMSQALPAVVDEERLLIRVTLNQQHQRGATLETDQRHAIDEAQRNKR